MAEEDILPALHIFLQFNIKLFAFSIQNMHCQPRHTTHALLRHEISTTQIITDKMLSCMDQCHFILFISLSTTGFLAAMALSIRCYLAITNLRKSPRKGPNVIGKVDGHRKFPK